MVNMIINSNPHKVNKFLNFSMSITALKIQLLPSQLIGLLVQSKHKKYGYLVTTQIIDKLYSVADNPSF